MTRDHAHNDKQDHVTPASHTHHVVPDQLQSESVTGDHGNKSHVTPDHAHHVANGAIDNTAAELSEHREPGHVSTDHAHKDHVISDLVTKSPSQTVHFSAQAGDLASQVVIQQLSSFFFKIYRLFF